jgi:eukaryotic-like serine/threonine-protein kinase
MDPELWQRIKEIVYEAVELRRDERQAYLERACNGDATLRREVETLVAASDQAGTFLDQAAPSRGPVDEDLSGSTIGPYRLTVEIGRGGMGIVYRAVREDEYRQFVASVKSSRCSIIPTSPGCSTAEPHRTAVPTL